MAQQLTVRAQSLLDQVSKEPQLIAEIEGVPTIFGVRPIFKFIRWDEDNITWDSPLTFWDGSTIDTQALANISFSGTTKTLGQQIFPDREGSSSFSAVNLELVDLDGSISKLLSRANIGEILARRARFYYGFAQGNHPEDSIPVMSGVITDFYTAPSTVNLTITHPETLKTQSIFNQYTGVLTNDIDDATTTIPVTSTNRFIESQDTVTSHIRIDDEIMEVIGVTDNSFEVIRSRFGSLAESHTLETEVVSNYRLEGTPLELALKLQLSTKGNEPETSQFTVERISNNEIIVDSYDIERQSGLTIGDTVILGNLGEVIVSGFNVRLEGNSAIEFNEDIADTADIDFNLTWRSRFNVFPDGLGMSTANVDVEQFQETQNLFGVAFAPYDFLLTNTIENVRDFINREIYFPQAMYSTPRNARSSVRYLSPPLTIDQLPTINETNITNITSVRLRRSTDRYFYNSVLHRYGESKRTGDFLAVTQTISGDSAANIPPTIIGNKQLNIESRGLVRNDITEIAVNASASRMLDRYGGAATFVEGVKLDARSGLFLEPTDVVYFGGEGTQFTDFNTGLRNAPIRKYEVINVRFNLESFEPSIDLLDTGFSLIGIYGVFSPSSFLTSNSTSTRLCTSFLLDICDLEIDRTKWNNLVGANVRVRSEDYIFDESTVITNLDPQDPNCLLIDPPLSTSDLEGFIVELDIFDNLDDNNEITRDIKERYTFTMDRTEITNVTDETIFDLSDLTGLFVGALVRVHSPDYVFDSSNNFVIIDITGNTVTLDQPLEFLPEIGFELDVLSFEDQDGYNLL